MQRFFFHSLVYFYFHYRHFQVNKCTTPLPVSQPDIKCEQCRKKFCTPNLYQWHNCFIKNKVNCRKCGQYFAKKEKLFSHFIKCPLPFMDLPKPKSAQAEKPKAKAPPSKKASPFEEKAKEEEQLEKPKEEADLDISELLQTNINETAEQPGGLEKINTLLNSVTDAIAKISSERSKKKKKKDKNKEKLKHQPLKIRIKTEPGTNESTVESAENVGEDEEDIAYIPQEEHFAEIDSGDDDDQSSSLASTAAPSGNVTPAIKIKQEKLDAGYGDALASIPEQDESDKDEEIGPTLQEVIQNIKKEKGTLEENAEKLAAAKRKSNSNKSSKAINPLALNKSKTSNIQKPSLILKIKKERSEQEKSNNNISPSDNVAMGSTGIQSTSNESEKPSTEMDSNMENSENNTGLKPMKAINPIAAGMVKKKKKKSNMLKIPREFALKIKKERAEKSKKQQKMPTLVRVKQEKLDTDEEHDEHEQPMEDYLGLNPLSIFKKKQQKAQNKLNAETEKTKESDVAVQNSSNDKTMPTIEKQTNSVETESMSISTVETDTDKIITQPNNTISSAENTDITSLFAGKKGFVMLKGGLDGPGLQFPPVTAACKRPDTPPVSTSPPTIQMPVISSVISEATIVQDSSPLLKPKTSAFVKISGNAGGGFQLQFPGKYFTIFV